MGSFIWQPVDKHRARFVFAGLRQREAVLPALHKLCVREQEPRYAPLQEAVVSFVHSRRLSDQIICVEYERVRVDELLQSGTKFVRCQVVLPANFLGAEPFSRQVTSEMLPDDVLLNIFCLYLHSSPQFWPTLTHISKRWRHLVFTSPLGLDLRLYCTYGTPVSKTLDCWPILPIVVQYGEPPVPGSPTPEDEVNIVAALKYSDRVTSIDLTMTSSLLDRLSVIETPFSELEELVLQSPDTVNLAHPRALRWGTRLRRLYLTRIALPALLELLSASTVLVDLQLHEIPNVGYFPPEAFANALSGMTQLETLSLHFLSFPTRRNHLAIPPQSGERVELPALTRLKYRGTSKYLDSFVSRIDAPRLGDIDVIFFIQPTMDASQLGRFIDRIETQPSFSQAEVRFSELAISISFTRPSSPTRLELRISCNQLDWQLSAIAQICHHFSPFISRVERLHIKASQTSSRQGNMDCDQLLKFIHPFRGVKDFHADVGLITDVLLLADWDNPAAHPSLLTLGVLELKQTHKLLLEAISAARLLSNHRTQVYAQGEYSCKICYALFTEQHELKKHLVVMHAYRLLCPYCYAFDFSPRYIDIFREHLASEHEERAHTDTLFLNSFSQSSRASVNFGAFIFFKEQIVLWPQSPTDSQAQVVHFLPLLQPT